MPGIAAAFAIASLLSAAPAGQSGELRAIRHYDSAVDATSERLEIVVQTNPVLHLDVMIVYEGRRLDSTPRFVDLLVSCDFATVADRIAGGDDVILLVDGRRFEREGASNLRGSDRRQTAARALVVPFDAFSRLAQATTIAGRAFGLDFVLSPAQLVALQNAAARWHRESIH
jgi:hypothetical protein